MCICPREREYIPVCMRRGVQVPLYKGKDTCILDPNNYRGITLLSTFHKIFEILVWNRLKTWWHDEGIISELQGACRGGFSCVHTAFMLSETVATSMETANKCFVAYFDVAKAFDTVWINGLFQQMYDLGIRGKTWRLLYRGYQDFSCQVKLQGEYSTSYELHCGIHQGGFLSLMKYTIFINSLLVGLKSANICCKLYRTPSTPLGYADDVATCCLSKQKLDVAMDMVHRHGRTWRYELNAKKSGVLIFGENQTEHERNVVNRYFRLGQDRVKERTWYDHVGIRNCIYPSDTSGVVERISKGRRAFNAITGIGIRRGGLTLATCRVIFWSIIVPTSLFGCELWIMNESNLNLVEDFQNFVGKKMQRFHPKTPNMCSIYGLGWMRLERIIQVKKMMFVRSILAMDQDDLARTIFCERAEYYFENVDFGRDNRFRNSVFDLLNVCEIFGLLDKVKRMVRQNHVYSKGTWRDIVWRKGWDLEDIHWEIEKRLHKSLEILKHVCADCRYLTWWKLSDAYPALIKKCETLSKIVSHTSMLLCDDFKLKNQTPIAKMCELCDLYEIEDARHLVLHCSFFNRKRNEMMNEISKLGDTVNAAIRNADCDILYILLGRPLAELNPRDMERVWLVSLEYISSMYLENVMRKRGIG